MNSLGFVFGYLFLLRARLSAELSMLLGLRPQPNSTWRQGLVVAMAIIALFALLGITTHDDLSRACAVTLYSMAVFIVPVLILRILGLVEFREEGDRGLYLPKMQKFDLDLIDQHSRFSPTVQLVIVVVMLLFATALQILVGLELYRDISTRLQAGGQVAITHYLVINLFGAYLAWPSLKICAIFIVNALRLISQEHDWIEEEAASAHAIASEAAAEKLD